MFDKTNIGLMDTSDSLKGDLPEMTEIVEKEIGSQILVICSESFGDEDEAEKFAMLCDALSEKGEVVSHNDDLNSYNISSLSMYDGIFVWYMVGMSALMFKKDRLFDIIELL
jgi:hypothetical protein